MVRIYAVCAYMGHLRTGRSVSEWRSLAPINSVSFFFCKSYGLSVLLSLFLQTITKTKIWKKDRQRSKCFSTWEIDRAIAIICYNAYFASAKHELIRTTKIIDQETPCVRVTCVWHLNCKNQSCCLSDCQHRRLI